MSGKSQSPVWQWSSLRTHQRKIRLQRIRRLQTPQGSVTAEAQDPEIPPTIRDNLNALNPLNASERGYGEEEAWGFQPRDPGSGLCPLCSLTWKAGSGSLSESPSSPSSTLICEPGRGAPVRAQPMWLSPACPAARHVDWKTVSWEGHGQNRGRRRRCQKGREG